MMKFRHIGILIVFGVLVLVGGVVVARKIADRPTLPGRALNEVAAIIGAADIQPGAPLFLRIIKTRAGSDRDGVLTAWMRHADGAYILIKQWPICAWSGELGPKFAEGDRQSPEGFYAVTRAALNPNSSYHLSFNLGFPNEFDQFHGRTGSFLMVHGQCVSIGCYAMGDRAIEEIYALLEIVFDAGQMSVPVHIFPFEVNEDTLQHYRSHQHFDFWRGLKPAWDYFEQNRQVPEIRVVNGAYQIVEER